MRQAAVRPRTRRRAIAGAAMVLAVAAGVAPAPAAGRPGRPVGQAAAAPAAPAEAWAPADGAVAPLPKDATYARQILLAARGRVVEPGGAEVRRVGEALASTSAFRVAGDELHHPLSLRPRVDQAFVDLLGRPAAAAQAERWTDEVAARRVGFEHLEVLLISSPEAVQRAGGTPAAWVAWAYPRLFGRAADPAGAAYWTARLEAGLPYDHAGRLLVRSGERARRVVAAAYEHHLRRPTRGDGAFWVDAYRLGRTGVLALGAHLLASAEARRAGCDPTDPRACLLPFPNDGFTVPDPATPTGRRIALKPEWMPRNAAGTPIDPTEWNRNDGFSPGQAALVKVPGVDLAATGAAPLTDIGASLDTDAPVVVVDADTGERHPVFVELDANVAEADRPADQLLYIRPAVNYTPGHRYVVALRRLRDGSGALLPAPAHFVPYRDGLAGRPVAGYEDRRPHLEQVFADLEAAGIGRHDLYLAWDFTVASAANTAGRMLHVRDDAFASLAGGPPSFTVTSVTPGTRAGVASRVEGTFEVPLYLTGDGSPGNGFTVGPDGLPVRNGTYTAPFDCEVPELAGGTLARPVVYGHGLLGSLREVRSGPQLDMVANHDMLYCATTTIGMSEQDIGNAAAILTELSSFGTLPDRSQQGILNTLFLGRLLKHPQGFSSHEAFQRPDGTGLIDTGTLSYDGNSQGGIIGGAVVAVSTDTEAGVLGVTGMNYSTLLERSVDFDPFNAIFSGTYLDRVDRVMGIGLIQMLWDRGETNGYAAHLTDRPLPGTPPHRVLAQVAVGDHQVATLTAEVLARTAGMAVHRPPYAEGRTSDVEPAWGIPALVYPWSGSALTIWDSGAPLAPVENVPPRAGEDPHSDPRRAPAAQQQKDAFLRPGGVVVDVCGDVACAAPPT